MLFYSKIKHRWTTNINHYSFSFHHLQLVRNIAIIYKFIISRISAHCEAADYYSVFCWCAANLDRASQASIEYFITSDKRLDLNVTLADSNDYRVLTGTLYMALIWQEQATAEYLLFICIPISRYLGNSFWGLYSNKINKGDNVCTYT